MPLNLNHHVYVYHKRIMDHVWVIIASVDLNKMEGVLLFHGRQQETYPDQNCDLMVLNEDDKRNVVSIDLEVDEVFNKITLKTPQHIFAHGGV